MSENNKDKNKLSLVPNNNESGSSSSSKLIMVIDNTQDILDLFEQLLTEEGYRVSLHYYNGRDLEEVKQLMPDLIISDHSLNEQEAGWQFLQKLKMDRQTQNILVIVCTAAREVAEDRDGRLARLGIKVLVKPFQIDELFTLVRELLG
jgi:CheY-like chemotaxis protein